MALTSSLLPNISIEDNANIIICSATMRVKAELINPSSFNIVILRSHAVAWLLDAIKSGDLFDWCIVAISGKRMDGNTLAGMIN
jgi:hypothetical protein